jgi:hypothetical protein
MTSFRKIKKPFSLATVIFTGISVVMFSTPAFPDPPGGPDPGGGPGPDGGEAIVLDHECKEKPCSGAIVAESNECNSPSMACGEHECYVCDSNAIRRVCWAADHKTCHVTTAPHAINFQDCGKKFKKKCVIIPSPTGPRCICPTGLNPGDEEGGLCTLRKCI